MKAKCSIHLPVFTWRLYFSIAFICYGGSTIISAQDQPVEKNNNRALISHITVPEGFTIERVAGPPLVERPMMAGFDDCGRLFVCDSSGFNLLTGTSDDLVKNPPHAIKMIEDTDGDGRFDKSTVFADKMTFPMGAQWYDGALYVASPPHVWRLKDTDGDGVADQRDQLVSKFDFGGNACDIHGPFLGPDGNLYWANCIRKFQIPRKEGGELKGLASGVFRIRPNGSQVEMLCAGGMDNPVEVAFTDEGEAFATVDLLIGSPRPRSDGIIHCVEGGLFPYRSVDRQFHRTGDVLPPMIDLGWVAPAGLMRYQDDALGPDYRNNLFSAHFNTRRIVRHAIEREGATFRGRSEDFLVSTDPDFHPTDVLQDADGSMLVVDTGGWFLRGCPTSQIAKPQVTGAIYRIKRKDAPVVRDARGLKLNWPELATNELVKLLDDVRFVVRDRAVEALSQRGDKAVSDLKNALQKNSSPRVRRNAVWALTRIDSSEARGAVRMAVNDGNESVRLSAVNSVGWWRDSAATEKLRQLLLQDTMPAVRREAATALGRTRALDAVPEILEALRAGGDRFLEHALIYALIQIDDRGATLAGLAEADPRIRRAALLALDQMAHGALTREEVLSQLKNSDPELQRTALTIAMAHPEWADGLASLLRQWLTDDALPENNRGILHSALVALSNQKVIQEVVETELARGSTPRPSKLILLDVIARAEVKELPVNWVKTLQSVLSESDEALVQQAVATIQTRNEPGFDASLIQLSRKSELSDELRLAALAAVAPRLKALDRDQFEYLMRQLAPNQPVLNRMSSASALGQLPLTEVQLLDLIATLRTASPVERPSLMLAFERSKDRRVGKYLIEALESTSDLDGLSAESLRRTLANFPDDIQSLASGLLRRLEGSLEQQTARLIELEPMLRGGNSVQGRIVFFGTKASCAACHTVHGVGTNLGPDLSKIGNIRTPRDLLESIAFPSASLVRSFESYKVLTTSGRVHSGLMKHSTADAVTLVTTERTEIRIPRAEIEDLVPSRTSIMPQGLDKQLTPEQLRDLIAYLTSLK